MGGLTRHRNNRFFVFASAVTLEAVHGGQFPKFTCAAAEDELRGWVVKTDAYAKYWCYPVSGEGVVPAEAALPEGKYLVIGLFRNQYGLYSTHPCFFDVKK